MKTKPIQVRDMDPDLWQRVKLRAVEKGITVRELVIRALTKYLEDSNAT